MSIASIAVEHSATLTDAGQHFLKAIRDWTIACRADYGELPASAVHDQATYTTSWEPYIKITQDADALAFMTGLRDQIATHFQSADHWHHGYWRMNQFQKLQASNPVARSVRDNRLSFLTTKPVFICVQICGFVTSPTAC